MNKMCYIFLLFVCVLVSAVSADEPVSIFLKNDLDSDRKEVPVFLVIKDILGPDYNFEEIRFNGFQVKDQNGEPVPYNVIAQKPFAKKGKDILSFVVPSIGGGKEIEFSIVYTGKENSLFKPVDTVNVAANLFFNPGFEEGENEQVTGFSYKGGHCFRDIETIHTGIASLCLEAEHNQKAEAFYAAKIPLTADRKYELRFWAKCENLPVADSSGHDATKLGGQATDCNVSWAGTAIKKLGFWHSWIKPVSGTRDWRMYSHQVTAKATKEIDFRWRVYYYQMPYLKQGPGRMWVDEALLYSPLTVRIDNSPQLKSQFKNKAVIFRSPLELPILPDTIPWKQQIISGAKGFEILIAQNDHETIQFGIHTQTELKGLTFSVSEIFPPEAMEVFRIDPDQIMRPLKAMDTAGGKSQGFAIRLKADEKTEPGVYKGIITIVSKKGTIGIFPLQVTVLPFVLPQVKDRFLGTCLPHTAWVRNNFETVWKNLADHSYNYAMYMTFTGVGKSMDDFDTFIKRHGKAGLELSAIGLYSDVSRLGSSGRGSVGSAAKYAEIEAEGKKRGWPPVVYMMDDELFTHFQKKGYADRPVDALVNMLKQMAPGYSDWAKANPKAIITGDMNFLYTSFFHEPYNFINFDNPYGGLNKQILDWVKNTLKKEYGICGAGGKNADLQRFHNGFYMLLIDSKNMWRWVYTQQVVYENEKIFDSVAHEALREGFDDIRLYHLLQSMINKAKSEGNAFQKAKAKEAEEWLSSVFELFSKDTIVGSYTPIEGFPGNSWGEYSFYTQWRNQMIFHVNNIKSAKKVEYTVPEYVKAGDPFPLTHMKFWKAGTGEIKWQKFFYRIKGEGKFKEAPVTDAGDGYFKTAVPGTATTAPFEFYIAYEEKGSKPVMEPPDGLNKPESVVPDMEKPSKVKELKTVSVKDFEVEFVWQAAEDDKGIAGYHIYKDIKESFKPEERNLLKEVHSGVTRFDDKDPAPGKRVFYAVQAVDVVGRKSEIVYLKVDVPVDGPPENTLTITASPASQAILLSWEGELEPDVKQIIIFRSQGLKGEMKELKTIKDLTVSRYMDKGLQKKTTYRYSLQLVDAAGNKSKLSPEISKKPLGYVRRINCGGDRVESADGIPWEKNNKGSSTSSTYKTTNTIEKAGKLQDVYNTERWSYRSIAYRFDVQKGTYKVILHFAECNQSFQAEGKRLFDIVINGTTVAKQVDVFKNAGANTAWKFEKTVEVKDGELKIQLNKNPSGPSLRGLEIIEVD